MDGRDAKSGNGRRREARQVFGGFLAGLRPTSGGYPEVGREAEVAEAH